MAEHRSTTVKVFYVLRRGVGAREHGGRGGWGRQVALVKSMAQGKFHNASTSIATRAIRVPCYPVFEDRGRTCKATRTLTKIFVWAMECAVNYHELIKRRVAETGLSFFLASGR